MRILPAAAGFSCTRLRHEFKLVPFLISSSHGSTMRPRIFFTLNFSLFMIGFVHFSLLTKYPCWELEKLALKLRL